MFVSAWYLQRDYELEQGNNPYPCADVENYLHADATGVFCDELEFGDGSLTGHANGDGYGYSLNGLGNGDGVGYRGTPLQEDGHGDGDKHFGNGRGDGPMLPPASFEHRDPPPPPNPDSHRF